MNKGNEFRLKDIFFLLISIHKKNGICISNVFIFYSVNQIADKKIFFYEKQIH